MNTSPQEGDLSFSVQWNKALKILFAEFAPAALTSIHGSPVHIEALNASDLSLSACAKFCYQYLKMKSGDLAIVNDPSSGGSSLDEICLVKAISLTGKTSSDLTTDFLISLRFRMGGTSDASSPIHSLRIPPTPIAMKNVLNQEILSAIGSHPGTSLQFSESLALQVEKLQALEQQLLRIKSLPGLNFSADQLELYFDSTKKSLLSWISKNLSNGEFHFQHKLITGETIKLRIECKENENILFDFIGTSHSEHFQLTEFMSFSACFAALTSLSTFEIPANQGSFSALQLRTPQNSMLNARQIKNTYLASRTHFKELCSFLRSSLLKLGRSGKNFASDSEGIGPCSIAFDSKRIWDFDLPGGQGGSSERNGETTHSLWSHEAFANRSIFESFSVEKTEKNFALQFQNLSKHTHISGKGVHTGGAGMQLKLLVLSEAELNIFAPNLKTRAAGQSGGKAGEKSEITVEFDEVKIEINASHKQKLLAKTLLRLSSGGGGGWGEEKIEEDD